jgi:hypothetical protein
MTADDSRLREAFARRAGDARPTPSCPPAERLWSAARGELIPETTQEVVLHTATCAACAEAWRLAVDVAREAALDRPAAVPDRRSRRAAWLAGGAALAAAAAIALFVWVRGRGGDHPIDRGGVAITSRLDERVPLPRDAAVLRWTSAGDGAIYTVRVTGDEFRVLFERAAVATTEVTIPPAALTSVAPGGRVTWQVDAVLLDGTRRQSPAFFATVTP